MRFVVDGELELGGRSIGDIRIKGDGTVVLVLGKKRMQAHEDASFTRLIAGCLRFFTLIQ
jgi:hypothetical protein